MDGKVRRVRDGLIALVVAGVLMVGEGRVVEAQTGTLTLNPREAATGTRTARAGKQTLDGEPLPPEPPDAGYPSQTRSAVYVPEQCVGTRRCPLLLMTNAPEKFFHHISTTYGFIVASLAAGWNTEKAATFDEDLRHLLRTFAIDPDKIAIAGRCGTGPSAATYGGANPQVFSRVIVGTQDVIPSLPAQGPKQEYFVASGYDEVGSFGGVQRLRDHGYPVTHSFQFRSHDHTLEEYNFWGYWLQQTWSIPDPAARPAPTTFGEPPLLTSDILEQLNTFWSGFRELPDSITTTARQALIREVRLPIGKKQISTLMVDMPAFAAKYPEVAALLKAAKLTPQQLETYRAAILGAYVYDRADTIPVRWWTEQRQTEDPAAFLGVTPTSALAKNFAFFKEHQDEFQSAGGPP